MAVPPPHAATPRRVYLVRHAQPALPDGRRRFLGRTDLPLTAHGIEQARLLAERLGDVVFGAAYCSPLQRSRHTADILTAGRPVAVQERAWLVEIDVGLWDLLAFDEVRRLYPEEYAVRESDLGGAPFPQGESLQDVEARVLPGFWSLLEETAGDVLVVGHRAVNVVLLNHLLGEPLSRAFNIRQEYCDTSIIELHGDGDGVCHFQVRLPTDSGEAQ